MESNPVLRAFADNPALMDAVKEVLFKYLSIENMSVTNDDKILGQIVRARLVATKAIEDAWREIALNKSAVKGVDKTNPAR